ncbi:hypothetical protein ACFL35_13010 [Candidatus Riflebacteria bacterium]
MAFDLRDTFNFSSFFSLPLLVSFRQGLHEFKLANLFKAGLAPSSEFEKNFQAQSWMAQILLHIYTWKIKINQEPAYNEFIEKVRDPKEKKSPLKYYARYFVLSDEFNGMYMDIWHEFRNILKKKLYAYSDNSVFSAEIIDRNVDPTDDVLMQNYFIYLVYNNLQELKIDYYTGQLEALEKSVESARLNFLSILENFNHIFKDSNIKPGNLQKSYKAMQKTWQNYFKTQTKYILTFFERDALELLSESKLYRSDGLLGRPCLNPKNIELHDFPIAKGLLMNLSNLIKKFILQEFTVVALDCHLEQEKLANNFSQWLSGSRNVRLQGKVQRLFDFNKYFSQLLKNDNFEALILKKFAQLLSGSLSEPGPLKMLKDVSDLFSIINSKLYHCLNLTNSKDEFIFENYYKKLMDMEHHKKNQALEKLMKASGNLKDMDYEFSKFTRWLKGKDYFKPITLKSNFNFINTFWLWAMYDFYLKESGLFDMSPYNEIFKKFMVDRKIIEVTYLLEVEKSEGGVKPKIWKKMSEYLNNYHQVIAKVRDPEKKSLLELSLFYHPLERMLLNFCKNLIEEADLMEIKHEELRIPRDLGEPLCNKYSLFFFAGFVFLRLREFQTAKKYFMQIRNFLRLERGRSDNPHAILYDILFELTRGFQTASNLYLNFSEAEVFSHTTQVLKKNYFFNYRYD